MQGLAHVLALALLSLSLSCSSMAQENEREREGKSAVLERGLREREGGEGDESAKYLRT